MKGQFMKVVIVDDDKLVAMSLKTIVESDKDIEVLATGSSGEEAISRMFSSLIFVCRA